MTLIDFRDGLRDGVVMTLDLLAGENSGQLPDAQFEELRYKGPKTEELDKWLAEAREKALAEKRLG